MIVTEMFLISYDLSWFSSLKNSHMMLLGKIIVHIDDGIKNIDVIKIDDVSKRNFCWIFWVVSYIVELFDIFWRR